MHDDQPPQPDISDEIAQADVFIYLDNVDDDFLNNVEAPSSENDADGAGNGNGNGNAAGANGDGDGDLNALMELEQINEQLDALDNLYVFEMELIIAELNEWAQMANDEDDGYEEDEDEITFHDVVNVIHVDVESSGGGNGGGGGAAEASTYVPHIDDCLSDNDLDLDYIFSPDSDENEEN